MKPKLNSKALEKLSEVSSIIPAADVLSFLRQVAECYQEQQITIRETVKIEAQKEIILKQIEKKYDAFYFVFEKVFEERKEAIHKTFDIIDRGLKENNKELIGMGLQSLSKVVSSSPFANIQQLQGMLESGDVIEI